MKKEELFNIIGEVDEQKVAAAGIAMNTKKKSRPVWAKWGAMAACLCLVVIGTFVSFDLQREPGGAGIQPGGTPSTEVIQPGNTQETTQPARTNFLVVVVNEVKNIMTADMDVQLSHYDSLSETEREVMLKQFETAIGLSYDDFTAKISDTYVNRAFYSMNVPSDAARTEYIPHDYVFEYQTESGGEAKIAICSAEEPLRDYFIKCDNPKQSEINGISVVIYGYQGTFMVEFSHENINYDIETNNITIEELEDLLVGIIE